MNFRQNIALINNSTRNKICFNFLSSKTTIPEDIGVFDRETKRRQRNWSASQDNFELAQYVKNEMGYRVADRVYDLTGFNDVVLDLGCGAGHIGQHLIKENVGVLLQCDLSEALVRRSKGAPENELPTLRIISDEELVTFRSESIDLITSCLSAHWINDLPSWFRRCLNILRPDGCIIGAMLAGETLHELRVSLQLAESERFGGIGAHISPFVEPNDVAALMNRAGFGMITIDIDDIEVGYPNIFPLMYDLQLMAESNCAFIRSANLRREAMIAADSIYKVLFSKDDRYPATFQIISFIGWRPGPKMPKPTKRGSQTISFKDITNVPKSN